MVERGGLENRWRRKALVGSNPTPSAWQRLQGRSLFAYLADVLGARGRGDPAPLLA